MMPETKLERAKIIALKKWLAIKEETNDLIVHSSNVAECGFCQEYERCVECEARTQCEEMERNFVSFIGVALDYLENDLIPWLQPPEEE